MLLKSYSKEIFRPECNPGFESVHCIAHLDQDISEVLPYLNAVLGGFDYLKDPPAVIFRSQGKLITVHGNKIAIMGCNAKGSDYYAPADDVTPGAVPCDFDWMETTRIR